MNELFMQHVVLAVFLSALISSTLEWIKGRMTAELSGKTWMVISFVVTLVVGLGYTMYYAKMPLDEAIAVVVIIVFGAQGFYQVFVDNRKTTIEVERIYTKE